MEDGGSISHPLGRRRHTSLFALTLLASLSVAHLICRRFRRGSAFVARSPTSVASIRSSAIRSQRAENMSSSPSAMIDDEAFDRAVAALRADGGVAVLELPLHVSSSLGSQFAVGRRALDVAGGAAARDEGHSGSTNIRTIGPNDDSAHATGYHPAGDIGSMSRYNAHREGFVFSDGDAFDVPLPPPEAEADEFRNAMDGMFHSLHDEISSGMLRAAERSLGLEAGWFQNN